MAFSLLVVPFPLTVSTMIYASKYYSLLQFLVHSITTFLFHLMLQILHFGVFKSPFNSSEFNENSISSSNSYISVSKKLGKCIRLRLIVSPLKKNFLSCTTRKRLVWYSWSFLSPSSWTWLNYSMVILLTLVSTVAIFFTGLYIWFPLSNLLLSVSHWYYLLPLSLESLLLFSLECVLFLVVLRFYPVLLFVLYFYQDAIHP